MPSKFTITAKPGIFQPLLNTYDIQLDLDIKTENTYERVWKFPTYIGMKVGLSIINGKITWSDGDGDYEVDLNGIATSWSMRALL